MPNSNFLLLISQILIMYFGGFVLQHIIQIPIDEELKIILEKDDVKRFMSLIKCNMDSFSSAELLRDVCVFGSIKCAAALFTAEFPLTVDLDIPCPETGLYPLHSAALSLLPSVTELFLYHGAGTNVPFEPLQRSNLLPPHLVEESTNKLPLDMSLLRIS